LADVYFIQQEPTGSDILIAVTLFVNVSSELRRPLPLRNFLRIPQKAIASNYLKPRSKASAILKNLARLR
jgi:hypothetical protein